MHARELCGIDDLCQLEILHSVQNDNSAEIIGLHLVVDGISRIASLSMKHSLQSRALSNRAPWHVDWHAVRAMRHLAPPETNEIATPQRVRLAMTVLVNGLGNRAS